MQPETIRPADLSKLEAAIAQAITQAQQEAANEATAQALAQRTAQQQAVNRFRLPFDDATAAVLPALGFRFEGDDLNPIAWFHYQDMVIEMRENSQSTHCETWTYKAQRRGVEVSRTNAHVYPNKSWVGYSTSEQRGRDFLVWLHEASHAPTPEPPVSETNHFGNYLNQKYREQFIKAAMKGTLTGLTHTGLEAGACLQTALFAIETAEQVLALMEATPLQRQVLKVLSLEQLTDWLDSKPAGDLVGSLNNEDHPVCRYLKTKGLELAFSNVALITEHGVCVLGNEGTYTVPNELPLDLVGAWLPAVLDWKTFDPDTQADFPTFTAGEVLEFLQPFQR